MFLTVTPIGTYPISFTRYTGRPDLKKLYDRGKLPQVKKGFYGDNLNKSNVTREHLIPRSKGGKDIIDNIVLASRVTNETRSNYDIRYFADKNKIKQYLEQFKNIKLPEFDGINYKKRVLKTLEKLGLKILD